MMPIKKCILNKYLYHNLYDNINIYDIWVICRLKTHGFKVYLCGSDITQLLIKERIKSVNIYTDANTYHIKKIFSSYKYINHHIIKIFFVDGYEVQLHFVSDINYMKDKFLHLLVLRSLVGRKFINNMYYSFSSSEVIDISGERIDINKLMSQPFIVYSKNSAKTISFFMKSFVLSSMLHSRLNYEFCEFIGIEKKFFYFWCRNYITRYSNIHQKSNNIVCKKLINHLMAAQKIPILFHNNVLRFNSHTHTLSHVKDISIFMLILSLKGFIRINCNICFKSFLKNSCKTSLEKKNFKMMHQLQINVLLTNIKFMSISSKNIEKVRKNIVLFLSLYNKKKFFHLYKSS